MVEEDDEFLRAFNEKRDASTQCSEDNFEEVMNFFEEIAQRKQPFAAVDSPPVVRWEEMEDEFDSNFIKRLRSNARFIYEHWKSRRIESGNKSLNLASSLKVVKRIFPTYAILLTLRQFETGADTDDGDPYVCFRRREVRQVRKTRGRDAQSAEKLKKLRKEMEDGRHLAALASRREAIKRALMRVDKEVFEQRASLRQVKCSIPEKHNEDDDDLLFNQKVKLVTHRLKINTDKK